ncbi:MAG: ArsR family transcriptional regulator [Thermodesulfovibrio sp.]|nr:ArsR family transcriptional regulator [Thermodesulfovibrio sp.]
MNNVVQTMKLLSDENRLRILMVLAKKELCVCQIMGVLEISQSLVSKNLHQLAAAGFLEERREGKLVYYALSKSMTSLQRSLLALLTDELKGDTIFNMDLQSLKECEEFRKKAGTCDMKTFKEFMNRKKKK